MRRSLPGICVRPRRPRRPPEPPRGPRGRASDRRARQQRRHDPAQPGGRAFRRGLGRRPRGQSHGAVRARSRAGARDARARDRQDRLHRIAPLVPGRRQRAGLRGEQRRHRTADEGARQRVGRPRCERQRRCSGVHPDRQHAGACRTTRSALARSWSAFRPAAGAGRRTCAAPFSSSHRPRRTTPTASCCRSTAAGSRDSN